MIEEKIQDMLEENIQIQLNEWQEDYNLLTSGCSEHKDTLIVGKPVNGCETCMKIWEMKNSNKLFDF